MPENNADVDRFFALSLDLYCIAGFDGYFKKVNPSWTETLGWTADELVARPYVEFIHPDDRDLTAREAHDLSTGTSTLNFENRYRAKDGSYRWLAWKAFPFVDEGIIYAAARDITEHKATEELICKAREEAERANRAKNDFLSRMSHDLRTPLNAILGFAQLLESETHGADQRESVRQILRGGRHLLDLINEILELARIESGRLALSPEAVSVDQIVQEAVDLVRPLAAERSIEIQIEGSDDGSCVFADRQRTRQVLLNLLSNAVRVQPRSRSSHAGLAGSLPRALPRRRHGHRTWHPSRQASAAVSAVRTARGRADDD